jgi:hypothetical protein
MLESYQIGELTIPLAPNLGRVSWRGLSNFQRTNRSNVNRGPRYNRDICVLSGGAVAQPFET